MPNSSNNNNNNNKFDQTPTNEDLNMLTINGEERLQDLGNNQQLVSTNSSHSRFSKYVDCKHVWLKQGVFDMET